MTDLNSLVELPAWVVVLTHATDINNVRQVIVNTTVIPEPQSYALMLAGLGLIGFIARRRKAENLGWQQRDRLGVLPGGIESKALGINDAGLVVGWSYSPEGQHAVLWNGTTAIDLNSFLDVDEASAGWVLRSANDINERGWIVGDAHNNLTRENHAFLLVPEPETYAMLLAGLGLLAFMARRKQISSPNVHFGNMRSSGLPLCLLANDQQLSKTTHP